MFKDDFHEVTAESIKDFHLIFSTCLTSNCLRWLVAVSSAFQVLYFDGSVQ